MSEVTLSNGQVVMLRAPTAGELRGVKLLDVMQLDPGACAPVIERCGGPTKLEFFALGAPDAMLLMAEVVGFFSPGPTTDSPPASKTLGP